MANKVYASPEAALADVLFDGMTIMSGGFGLSGNPEKLIPAIQAAGVRDLTIIAGQLAQVIAVARLHDEVLVKEAPGDVGDGLRGQAHNLGKFHAAEAAGGPADGVQDHREVEVPHFGQVGSAPR